ncbi:MAG: glycosyltransferase [Bacteroidia bacterium]|nr:glycosyltransferase [Bacteroidia bacterium]
MANVLYLSYDGMTDPLGQSQVLPYLDGLAQKGFTIHLISLEKKLKTDLFKKVSKKIAETGINWFPVQYHKNPPVISTLSDLLKMYNTALKIIKKENVALIHSRSYPASVVALKLKQKTGVPFIFDMRGFWADERVEGKLWNLRNPVFKLIFSYFKKQERILLNEAAAVVSLTENAKHWLIHEWKHNENKVPVYVIPCCCDTNLFMYGQQEKSVEIREKLKIPDDVFILIYLGSIGTWYMLDEMLDFFTVLKKLRPSSVFLFITQHEHELIRAKAAEKNISELKIVTGQRDELPELLSLGNAAIFFIRPGFSKKASSPVKQAELMAMGIPVVTNKGIGDSDAFYNDGKAGILIEHFNEDAYYMAANNLIHFFVRQEEIRAIALKNFSLQSGIELYETIYKRIIN